MDSPALVADENVNAAIITALRASAFRVVSVRETMGGATDREVMQAAIDLKAILITEDSDFGELIFSYGVPSLGVIYLRYSWQELDAITRALLSVLATREVSGSFITITPNKLRVRRLP